jgi:hypothetical protein
MPSIFIWYLLPLYILLRARWEDMIWPMRLQVSKQAHDLKEHSHAILPYFFNNFNLLQLKLKYLRPSARR